MGELRKTKFVDVSRRVILVMQGGDAQDLLHRISTNDISRLKIGEAVGTILTTEKGRIIDKLITLKRSEDDLLLIGESAKVTHLSSWIEKFIIMEDVTLKNYTDQYSHFLIYNVSDSLVSTIHGDSNRIERSIRDYFGESNELILLKEHYKGIMLLHCLVTLPPQERLQKFLADEGSIFSLEEEYDRFRIEHLIPANPNELSEDFNPLEAGLNDLISFTKGCYVGQEVIARLDTYQKT